MSLIKYWEDEKLPTPERWLDASGRVLPGPDDRGEHEREVITRRSRDGCTVTGSRVTPRRVLVEVQAILDKAARRLLDERLRDTPPSGGETAHKLDTQDGGI